MKKIAYHFMLLLLMFSVFSCEEENYKDMNIANYEEEIDIKEFVGDLTSHIVVKKISGDVVSEVNMGETFYIIDNTAGGASERTWTITQGTTTTITSDEKFLRLNFPKPGLVTLQLTSTRASDGESVTSETTVDVLSIPVAGDFITDPVAVNGAITILQGASISFTSQTVGSPTIFEWVFEGPETLTSSEKNPTMTFTQIGTYDVTLTMRRDDGEEGISEAVIVKQGFVVVNELIVRLVRAVAGDGDIIMEFNHPVGQTIPANLINEFAVTIKTAAGATLTPALSNLAVNGPKSLKMVFADKMYSNDEVLLTFNASGAMKDATGLTSLVGFADEPCVYAKNLWTATDMEDPSKFTYNDNNSGGIIAFVDASSVQYAMEPYQGNTCMALVRGSGNCSVQISGGLTFEVGQTIELAYEHKRVGNISGALERRVCTVANSGSNDAGGNWSNANDAGLDFWKTIRKTIVVGTGTIGKSGLLHFNFMRYGGSETEPMWIDNVRLYYPDPRP